MARRRADLPVEQATNEGARRLRVLLLTQTFAQIARHLLCDEGAVRHYARMKRKPNAPLRKRARSVFDIPDDAWDDPPSSDVYAAPDPPTTRRA